MFFWVEFRPDEHYDGGVFITVISSLFLHEFDYQGTKEVLCKRLEIFADTLREYMADDFFYKKVEVMLTEVSGSDFVSVSLMNTSYGHGVMNAFPSEFFACYVDYPRQSHEIILRRLGDKLREALSLPDNYKWAGEGHFYRELIVGEGIHVPANC